MTARRGLVGVALLVLVAGGCSKDVAANDLEVGDCTAAGLEETAEDIETVSCDEEHLYEVFATFELEGDEGADFPGRDDVEVQADDGCTGQRFEDYIGLAYVESDLYTQPVVPKEDAWEGADDRTVICFVFEPEDAVGGDLAPVTLDASLEGAAR